MAKVLKQTVLAGGVLHPAGTPATEALEDQIPARFWSTDAATDHTESSAEKPKRPRKPQARQED
jgi:hypothetical protein